MTRQSQPEFQSRGQQIRAICLRLSPFPYSLFRAVHEWVHLCVHGAWPERCQLERGDDSLHAWRSNDLSRLKAGAPAGRRFVPGEVSGLRRYCIFRLHRHAIAV